VFVVIFRTTFLAASSLFVLALKRAIFFLLVVAKFFSSWLQNFSPRGCKTNLLVVAKCPFWCLASTIPPLWFHSRDGMKFFGRFSRGVKNLSLLSRRPVSPSRVSGQYLLGIGRLRTLSSKFKLRNFDHMEIRQCTRLQLGVITVLCPETGHWLIILRRGLTALSILVGGNAKA